MILTTSNVIAGLTPDVTLNPSLTDDPANMTNPDFSLNYNSSSKFSMEVEFGLIPTPINYVVVAGINIAGNGDGTSRVRVRDTVGQKAVTFIKRDHCVILLFEEQTFTNLRIGFLNTTQDKEISVAYIAAGRTLTVPNNGETAGYSRHWLNRQIKTKTTTNQLAAPVTTLRKPVAVKGTLSIPNALATFSQEEYQDFLDFAERDLFFINEDETKGESTYCCFEIVPKPPKAHSETRTLNNLSFSFKVFNGLV